MLKEPLGNSLDQLYRNLDSLARSTVDLIDDALSRLDRWLGDIEIAPAIDGAFREVQQLLSDLTRLDIATLAEPVIRPVLDVLDFVRSADLREAAGTSTRLSRSSMILILSHCLNRCPHSPAIHSALAGTSLRVGAGQALMARDGPLAQRSARHGAPASLRRTLATDRSHRGSNWSTRSLNFTNGYSSSRRPFSYLARTLTSRTFHWG